MVLKLFGLLLFWGLGLWIAQQVRTQIRRGDMRGYVPKGWPVWNIRHNDDLSGFWLIAIVHSFLALCCFIAGLLVLMFVNSG
jgi:hypothetical protein